MNANIDIKIVDLASKLRVATTPNSLAGLAGFKFGRVSYALKKRIVETNDPLTFGFFEREFDQSELPEGKDTFQAYSMRGRVDQDEIFLVRQLPGRKAIVKMSGIKSGDPAIAYNKAYYHWSTLRFTEVPVPIKILAALVEFVMLKKDIVPLHCSSFCAGNAAHMIVAPPETGKSQTVIRLASEGLEYLGEDLGLWSDGRFIPVPMTATVEKRRALPVLERLSRLVWCPPLDKRTVYESYGLSPVPVKRDYDLGNIYYIRNGLKTNVERVQDRKVFGSFLENYNAMEFSYYDSKILKAFLLANDGLGSVCDVNMAEVAGLQSLVASAKNIYLVSANNKADFARLVMSTLDRA